MTLTSESLRLAFWVGAFLLLCTVCLLTFVGWRAARSGNLEQHRSIMTAAGALVAVFLAGYILKLLSLGAEDLSSWSHRERVTLWIHEAMVAMMMLCAIGAQLLARFGKILSHPADSRSSLVVAWHRRLGRTAAVACLGALLSSGFVLAAIFRATSE